MSDDIIQVLMTAPHRARYEEWLAEHDLMLAGPLPLDGEDVPTYIVTPTDEVLGL